MRIPALIMAGDSVQWEESAFADTSGAPISAPDYALKLALRGPSVGLDVIGVASGTGWLMTLTAAQTASLNGTPGLLIWSWQAQATKGALAITAGTGQLRVKPSIAGLPAATTFDGRSQAEQILAAIETEIAARINGGATLEYTIGTRSLKKEPLAALMGLRGTYRAIVSRERRKQGLANGLGNPGRVGVRFK